MGMTFDDLMKLEIEETDRLIVEMTPEERTAILESVENDDGFPIDLSLLTDNELIEYATGILKFMHMIVSCAHARMDKEDK